MTTVDDYAKYLSEEARSTISALHQFRILYEPQNEDYHFFFEGEDDALFYMPDARRRIGTKQVHIYDCGGKKNVSEARETIKRELYDINKCLFFIDRDYDDFLGCQVGVDQHTYVTDEYSIENYLSNVYVAKIILADILKLSHADPEFRRMERIISEKLSLFYKKILPLSAWIIAAKQEGCAPNLRNTVGLKHIVTLSNLNPIITKEGFEKFKKKVITNNKTPKIWNVIKWARILKGKPAKQWVRGKYDIWFFHILFLATLEDTNSRRRMAGGRIIRIPGSIREGRFFEILGGRVAIPPSLNSFYNAKLH